MKKVLKYLLIAVGLICVLLALLLGVLLIPGVQKIVIESALNQPGRQVELERVVIRPGTVNMSKVQLRQEGLQLDVSQVQLAWSPLALLTRNELQIVNLEVDALQMRIGSGEVREETPAPASLPEEDAQSPLWGVMLLPELPLRIDRVRVDGSVQLASGQRVELQAKGEGIAPATEGEIDWVLRWQDDSLASTAHGTVSILQGEKRWQSVRVNSRLFAEGELLSEPLELALDGELRLVGEGAEAELTLMRTDLPEPTRMAQLQLLLIDGQQLNGQLDINLTDAAVRPFVAGLQLPVFRSAGQFAFGYDLVSEQGRIQGGLEGEATNWRQMEVGPAEIPALSWQGAVSAQWDESLLSVQQLQLAVGGESAASRMVEVHLLEPFIYRWSESNSAPVDEVLPLVESLQVDVRALPLAWLSPFVEGMTIGGFVDGAFALRSGEGDVLELRPLTPVQLRELNLSNAEPLLRGLRLQATPTARLSGARVDLFVEALEVMSPEGRIGGGELRAGFSRQQGLLEVTGQMDAALNTLASQPILRSKNELLPAGDWWLKLDTAFSFDTSLQRLNASKCTLTLADGETEQGKVELSQPLSVSLSEAGVNFGTLLANVEGEVVSMTVDRLPLSHLSRWIPQVEAQGWLAQLNGSLRREGGKLSFVTANPIVAQVLQLAYAGKPLLANVDFYCKPLIEFDEQGLFVRSIGLRAQTGTVALLDVEGAVRIPLGDTGALSVDHLAATMHLAALASQPGLRAHQYIAAGTAHLVADGSPQPGGRFVLNFEGNDWRLGEPLRHIDQISAAIQADWSDPQRIQVQAPLRIVGPLGATDLTASGWADVRSDANRFDLQLTGTQVVVEDLLLIAGVLSAGNEHSEQLGGVAREVDAAPAQQPLWGAWQGRMGLRLERIVQEGLEIRDIRGDVLVTPSRVQVPQLSANLTGSILTAQGQLQFIPNQRSPYALNGSVHLPDFDLGRFLLAGGGAAPMEGLFQVNFDFNSRGEDIAHLLRYIQGDFDLKGSDGAFRILAATGSETIGNTIGVIAAQLGGRVRELRVVNDLIGFLREVPYDQLAIRASRGQDLNIHLSQVLLVGPELMLEGSGGIRYREGIPFAEQALMVDAQLAARGNLAQLFSQLRLMQPSARAAHEFMPGPSFRIGGTASNPDFTSLRQIIERAAVGLITSGLRSQPEPEAETEDPPRSPDPLRSLLEGIFSR